MSQTTEPEHNRKQFQVDRIAFSSDAVIAIAITLTVLEIKIPELGKETTFQQVLQKYTAPLVLQFSSLLIGFITVGQLWIRHHELYEHIVDYNSKLIKINLVFLFSVMLLPISISFMFKQNEPPKLQQLSYFGNLFLCFAFYTQMRFMVLGKKYHLSSLTDENAIRMKKRSALLGTSIFLLVVILVLMNVKFFYAPFLLTPFFRLFRKKTKTKKT